MLRARTILLGLSVLATGCMLRTSGLLDKLNGGSSSGEPNQKPYDPAGRIAKFTKAQLSDAYFDPTDVAKMMRGFAQKPDAVLSLASCIRDRAGGDTGGCYREFSKFARKAIPEWNIPAPPDAGATGVDLDKVPRMNELDAERFLSNATNLGSTLVAFRQAVGQDIDPALVRQGLLDGAEQAAQYVTARKWRRELKKPRNALVLGGGAANGAFSAGAVHRLLRILGDCKKVATADGGCGDVKIDFVSGTSTGSLIGTLVDVFHTSGRQDDARKLLVSNYTCSVASQLYCRHSTWTTRLFTNLRGLVKFDGIELKLKEAISPADGENGTELVTVAVDYASSDVFAISDQDPADLMPLGKPPNPYEDRIQGRIQGVLASIVEPVLGEPVTWIPSSKGPIKGAFMDGGVRSYVPLVQAAMRGAERVAVFSNSGVETGHDDPPKNAGDILLRTLDLFVTQHGVGEVQQAELLAVARRFGEYNVCMDRLEDSIKDDPTRAEVNAFCERRGSAFEPPVIGLEQAAPAWLGPARFSQVATSWRTSWVFKPETGLPHASAYDFNPIVMRPMFLGGVKVFQQRCDEMRRLFGIGGKVAEAACRESPDVVAAMTEREFEPIGKCTVDLYEKRECE